MKLMIQIPCYNEQATLPETLKDLPQTVAGFDQVEVLVIDDGSTDDTVRVAEGLGVDHIVRLPQNRGLALAFAAGISRALELGADVIVNTDGDHQYKGSGIERVVRPILEDRADVVIGDRQVNTIAHFSPVKKLLQRWGSGVVSRMAGTRVADATSGFRAFSRLAASRLFVFSSYTYTLETIIQAGKKGLVVLSVPVETNPMRRDSRLIRSTPEYVVRSAWTMLRIFLLYEPLRVFTWLSLAPALVSAILFVRYLLFFLAGEGSGHVQSFIVAAVLALLAFQVFLLGLLSDLIGRNRRLAEESLFLLRESNRLTGDGSSPSETTG